MFGIGELASRSGVGVDALRYYERIGLMPRAQRSSGGQRRYADVDLARLRFIRRAQAMNFSLAEIADLLSLREQPGDVREEVRALTETKLDGMSVSVDSDEVEERRLPLAGLASVSGAGWWGRKIHLVANDMTLFDGIPGADGERLTLRVARRDRGAADDLVATLSFALSDLGHAHLDEQLRRLEGEAGDDRLPSGDA